MRFTVLVHLGGTLAANQAGVIKLPCAATLVEVSAGASNDSDATLKVGTPADDDGVLKAAAIGDDSDPKVWDRGDFDGALTPHAYKHFAHGDLVTWALDFDGSSGTAAADVDVLFTFLEG